MRRTILLLAAALLLLTAACGPSGPQATAVPFNRFTINSLRDAFAAAGVPITALLRDPSAGRDSPMTFNDRYTFSVERIAPEGGQVLFFSTPEALQSWTDYIAHLRADSTTRRDVVYTYVNGNALLQLNADLLPAEARVFEDAFNAMR